MNETKTIKKGLDGVLADQTSISLIDPPNNRVLIRGYQLVDLAKYASYEQVAYLLIEGSLPPADVAREKWRSSTDFYRPSEAIRQAVARGKDPSLALTAIIAEYGLQMNERSGSSLEALKPQAWSFLTQMPLWVASLIRPTLPIDRIEISLHESESSSAGFLKAAFGRSFSDEEVRVFDQLRILYCEHGFNAASFAARVTASTDNDLHSAVTAAAACLKGDNHGGAVRLIMPMLEKAIAAGASRYVEAELSAHRKIPGFGHRIYKRNTDSRFPTILGYLRTMSERTGNTSYFEGALELQRLLAERKNLHPNLELASAPTLKLFGIESSHMVNFICLGRAAGWCAHIIEQCSDNRIIRPDAEYVGPELREVKRKASDRRATALPEAMQT